MFDNTNRRVRMFRVTIIGISEHQLVKHLPAIVFFIKEKIQQQQNKKTLTN